MSETAWQALGATLCVGSMVAAWLHACRSESRPWRQVLANALIASIVLSGLLLALAVAFDREGWMLLCAAVFFGSCAAFVKLVGPAVGATD